MFLTDITHYSDMNIKYGEALSLSDSQSTPPTRAAFAVKSLPLCGLVEVAGVASLSKSLNSPLISHGASPVYSTAMTTVGGGAAAAAGAGAAGGEGKEQSDGSGRRRELVWVSGQVALDPTSETKILVGNGDISAETEQCLKNVQSVLEQCNSSMVKKLVYI